MLGHEAPDGRRFVPKTLQHRIGGKPVDGTSGRFGDVFDPGTGAVSARAPYASTEEVHAAVQAAKAAWPGWAATPPAQRARVMFRFRDLVEQHKLDVAKLVASEHGKTLDDALGSVLRGAEIIEFACGIPQLL